MTSPHPTFDHAVEVLANGLRRRRHTVYSDEGLAAYLLESLTLGPNPLATLVDPDHHEYTSTACLHGHHTLCRRLCKFCGESCACTGCDHTGIEDRPGRELHRGTTLATGEPGSLVQAVVDRPPGSTVVVYAAADPDVCPLCARGDHNGCSGCRCADRGHYGLDTNALGHKENR